ncbi:DUF3563 family protein [Cupriavidus pampae]|uniref:DUF3563 domain-containing protein n=1 Tax=Cupriavidus pampae TaxID=659251 RepID=A0ABN7ZBT1_9BURK|nr:DUF3563 family protein [Cupriavidus pampae]CAG9181705.1 hypothetical protein LMG32289_04906 [Cupriavidus pampae]
MFAKLIACLNRWMETSTQHQADAWLAGSADLPELERRMRSLDENGWHH